MSSTTLSSHSRPIRGPARDTDPPANPWRALWAMMVGFFMILVDSTIVAVANPVIKGELNADYDAVIWVTSAYLLAYAVPLLLAGRLGDRFGPKNLYLLGLAIFTGSSLWCGLSGTIDMLIVARVVQGIGAGLLTPQTLSMITRIFPPERRGAALSLWGATAGVATLVGPVVGGLLVDGLGWQWIFFINVPIGVVGLGLAVWLIPVLPTQRHRFDLLGVLLSSVGMFLIVFGLQEGQSHDWAGWIWGVIVSGVAMIAAFAYWQAVNTHEPLVPLRIFQDRNFSLSNLGIAVMGFAAVSLMLPLMFYLQAVCGLSPTRAALVGAPTAITTGVLAPVVGRIVDRSHPRPVIGFGFSMLAIALTWLSLEMTPTTPIWRLVLPLSATGVGMAFIWAPLAATATRNLPAELAGAGSGVYNAIRQVGSVLGSASMAAFMTWRIGAEMPEVGGGGPSEGSVTRLPQPLHLPFSNAMSQSILLPAFVSLAGVAAALFLLSSSHASGSGEGRYEDADDTERFPVSPSRGHSGFGADEADDEPFYFDGEDDYVEYTVSAEELGVDEPDDEPDTEPIGVGVAGVSAEAGNTVSVGGVSAMAEDSVSEAGDRVSAVAADSVSAVAADSVSAKAADSVSAKAGGGSSIEQQPDPFDSWHFDLVESPPAGPAESRSVPPVNHSSEPAIPPVQPSSVEPSNEPPKPSAEPIGFAHNGFHVDRKHLFRDLHEVARKSDPVVRGSDDPVVRGSEPDVRGSGADLRGGELDLRGSGAYNNTGARHRRDDKPRHHRLDSDGETYGRHAMPSRD
jgi:EmrB/QacA subfamily drug resistance transporter